MGIQTILIAEGDPSTRRMAEAALRRDGYIVQSVGSGLQALQLIEERVFDLVIVDGLLPQVDGLEVCLRIKANPLTAHLAVIYVTPRRQRVEVRAAQLVGATRCIGKPLDEETLVREVRAIGSAAVAA